MFAAVPITFQQYRGWSAGIAGLAFVPIGIGMLVRHHAARHVS